MDQHNIDQLAEKIARLISGPNLTDLHSIRKSIDNLSSRLDRIEAGNSGPHTTLNLPQHPSQDRFAVAEAIVDGIVGKNPQEKTCTFEPNDRPCDHCSMCSSRGF